MGPSDFMDQESPNFLSLIAVLLCLLVLLPACGSRGKAGEGDSTANVAEGAPAQVLARAEGGAGSTTGIMRIPEFEMSKRWELAWDYDCLGEPGRFSVTFGPQSGQEAPIPVRETGLRGEGIQRLDTTGAWRLTMSSRCTWHVEARQAR